MSDRMPPLPAGLAGAVDLSGLAARHDAAGRQAPARGQGAAGESNGGTGAVSSVIVEVGEADFGRVVELSSTVPVIVDLWSERSEASTQLTPVLERLVTGHEGRLVLAKVHADRNPQIAQAFQAQSIPTVAAIIGGAPAPLFSGAQPEQQIAAVLEQVLAFAAQQGVTGRVPVGDAPADEAEQEEPPLPPLHQEAFDAIERGDHAAAITAYEQALVQNPRDKEAVAGLAHVRLLQRLASATADEIRARAAGAPDDVEAQMAVADLDVSGGHVEDAFLRLLDLVAATTGDERQAVRLRLIDLFEIVGVDDPRVGQARRRLSALLY